MKKSLKTIKGDIFFANSTSYNKFYEKIMHMHTDTFQKSDRTIIHKYNSDEFAIISHSSFSENIRFSKVLERNKEHYAKMFQQKVA